MTDEIIETAKATQEVAKTVNKGLEVSEKFGGFLAKILGEPIENAIGLFGDKLKYMRWERQIRLIDRVNEINKSRNNLGKEIPVPPKLAIPIIENASLEEDNNLQDLWAKLLASAQNSESTTKVRIAFVDIIKQLDPKDVIFIDTIYKSATHPSYANETAKITKTPFDKKSIINHLQLGESDYENIVDNLMRVRCIKSEIKIMTQMRVGGESATIDRGYESICLTELGVNFVESCVK